MLSSLKIGVWQGDNVSPIFFKIFLNDLPDIFDKGDDQVQLDNNFISSLLYADDLMLLSTSKAGLQRCIDKLASYSEDNCLTVNLKKTKLWPFVKVANYQKKYFILMARKYKIVLPINIQGSYFPLLHIFILSVRFI